MSRGVQRFSNCHGCLHKKCSDIEVSSSTMYIFSLYFFTYHIESSYSSLSCILDIVSQNGHEGYSSLSCILDIVSQNGHELYTIYCIIVVTKLCTHTTHDTSRLDHCHSHRVLTCQLKDIAFIRMGRE